MDNRISIIFNQEYCLKNKYKFKFIDILFFAIITIFAIFARISMFNFASGDYNSFLHPWFLQLEQAGGLKGIGLSLGDYTPPYIYILALLTYLPIDSLVTIKMVSCIFDFLLAFIFFIIVFKKTQMISKSLFAYSAILFAPTIILNSAMWAQCDIIFTTFLVLCVYSFIKEKPIKALVFFSIAFIFKLQAIFIAPFLIFMWLKGRMKFKHFFIIPAIYLISILPAFFMGRPLIELLTIYFSQSGQYKNITLNAPNIYNWMSQANHEHIAFAGILLCGVVVLCILYFSFKKQFLIDDEIIIAFALLFSLIVPFLLPHMHERYFYVADVFSILYAFNKKNRFTLSLSVILCSLLCYCPYLFSTTPINLSIVGIIMLIIILFVMNDIKNMINEKSIIK